MIGRVIKGRYKVYDTVGSGGFATVYLGRNMDTNEIVAIKVLSKQHTGRAHYVERFRREARLAQRLQHPNIVRVLDHGIEDGIHFLIMEFVSGLTVDEVLERKGRLSVEETVSYVEQACAGLQAAFEVGIVHRDIKPANLMITPDGTVKIMDFGIARMESLPGLTQTGSFLGTPRYISPEMARGSRTDIRSDLYSLGLITYEMLAGGPPFDAQSPWAILRLQVEGDPAPIRQIRPDVPAWLEAFIFRAVAKDPGERFQTPAEMLAALKEQTAQPVRAVIPTPEPQAADATLAAQPRRERGASRTLVVGLAIAATTVALALVVLLVLIGGRGDATPTPVATLPVAQAATDTPPPTITPIIVVVTNTPAETVTVEAAAPAAVAATPTHPPLPATDTIPSPTNTSPPELTDTPAPRPTDTPAPQPTGTPEPTATQTPGPTNTPRPTDTPTSPPPPAVTGRIVFSAGGALHIVQAATGQDTVVPIAGMRQPDYRRDGRQVLAKGFEGDKTSMWTINADTGAFLRQQSGFTDDYNPFWAPSGDRLVYDSFHHGLGRYQMLYIQQLDDRSPQPEIPVLYSGTQIRGTSPVWMDNDWLAFTGCDYWPNDRGEIGGSNCGIYRMPSWGGAPALIRSGGTNMRATDEQGGQLVYMTQEDGDWEVYVVPVQGGEGRNLSSSPGSHDGLGTFSPDGKLVAFVSNRGGSWAIWSVRPDGGGLTKLFTLPAPLTGTWTEEHISWGP